MQMVLLAIKLVVKIKLLVKQKKHQLVQQHLAMVAVTAKLLVLVANALENAKKRVKKLANANVEIKANNYQQMLQHL
jgi:hypothetical protein